MAQCMQHTYYKRDKNKKTIAFPIVIKTLSMQEKKIGVGFGIMVVQDKKILLGKRHEDPKKASSLLNGAGTWTMPGGKLHFQETFEDGAKRETLEETSINLNTVQVMCVNQDMVETAHFVTIGLFSDDFEGIPKVMEPDEITEWQWFSLNDLPHPMYPPSLKIIQNYKQKKFYIS
ncbi:MAG: NUDIX domain-containing protein [bacterium]